MMRLTISAVCSAALLAVAWPATQSAAQNDPVYEVKEGKVDRGTYNGYRRYGDACLRCHGQGGAGGSFGPALTESLTRLNYEQFTEVVINGRQGGATSVMPGFGEVQDVATYIDDIYGYLKARSDNKIPASRPQRF